MKQKILWYLFIAMLAFVLASISTFILHKNSTDKYMKISMYLKMLAAPVATHSLVKELYRMDDLVSLPDNQMKNHKWKNYQVNFQKEPSITYGIRNEIMRLNGGQSFADVDYAVEIWRAGATDILNPAQEAISSGNREAAQALIEKGKQNFIRWGPHMDVADAKIRALAERYRQMAGLVNNRAIVITWVAFFLVFAMIISCVLQVHQKMAKN